MIKSAPFSFIRFEHPDENDYSLDIPFTLPALAMHEAAFQFVVSGDVPQDQSIRLGIADVEGGGATPFNPPVFANPLRTRYRLGGISTTAAFYLRVISIGSLTKEYNNELTDAEELMEILFADFGIELNDEEFIWDGAGDAVTIEGADDFDQPSQQMFDVSAFWHLGHVSAPSMAITQEAFSYCLLLDDGSVLGWTNPFRQVDEEAFTSLLTYRCSEPAFDFVYTEGLQNKVRLPFYLKQPQFPTTRQAYKKSSGSSLLLSASVEKEYTIETEQMPEVFHECLKVALIHDTVIIENVNIREKMVQVLETDSYNPQWDGDGDMPFAPGKGKVKVATYGYTNSNC